MTTKTTALGTPAQVHIAAPGAAAAISNPNGGTEAKFERFLAEFGQTGYHKKAAESAGLALEAIAARIDSDDAFAERYRVARRTRRMLVEDAVLQEALGVEHTDPINGKVSIVRDLKTLHRLAVKDEVLDPENKAPSVAIQNNVSQPAAADPQLLAYAKRQQDDLRALLARARRPGNVIDVTPIEPAALPSPADGDSDADLL